ncbi:2-oxoacid:ferredoxin oxidoreductase subunit beta [bacterium]|nr:2-oxoacid:ferredoxin oxidoreductase subunit beta [bacterium]
MNQNSVIVSLANALERTGLEKVCVVSDVLYKKGIADYLGVDLFHTTRGRTIAFGVGLKLGNPKLKIIVLMGDLVTIGGNHFMHAARRNIDLTVICINNFIYKLKNAPSVNSVFPLYICPEQPFNIPHLAKSCGAVYVARWTALHKAELTNSIAEALQKQGFSVIEAISPGEGNFAGVDGVASDAREKLLKFYYDNSEIKDTEPTENLAIDSDKKIIVGKFVDWERPTFIDLYNNQLRHTLGNKFVPYE